MTRRFVTLCLALLLIGSPALAACGDCDQSGSITILDALLGAQLAVGLRAPLPTESLACNVQGALLPDAAASIDVLDALAIAQVAAGEPTMLACAPPLAITTTAICAATLASSYLAMLEAAGGSGTGYTWTLVGGTLPPGLALAPLGTPSTSIDGIASTAGAFAFTVRVTDDFGATAERDLALAVSPPGALAIVTCTLPPATAGIPYDETILAAGGTQTGLSWRISAGAVPAGLLLEPRGACLSFGAFTTTADVDATRAPDLTEISGVVASRRNPGILWVHDDSGSTSSIWAIDFAGQVRQEFQVAIGAIDWEDLALGPGPDPDLEYLYIGDVGDNTLSRSDVHILRLVEPLVGATPLPPIVVPHEAFYLRYPFSARNCETLIVDWESGDTYLVEKATLPVRVSRLAAPLDPAWTQAAPTTAVDLLPAPLLPPTLTAGEASRDGRRICLRSYGATLWELARPAGVAFAETFRAPQCPIAFPAFQQYEAMCYSSDGTKLVSMSERSFGSTVPIYVGSAAPGPLDTRLAGTPTTPGDHAFTVTVTDSSGARAEHRYVIQVE